MWDYDSRTYYEMGGDIERKAEIEDGDGVDNKFFFETTVKRRPKD